MIREKYTKHEIAGIVDCEGLDYAIQHYCSADSISDPVLAARWAEAKEALEAVEAIIFPNGIEAWQESGDEDIEEEEIDGD